MLTMRTTVIKHHSNAYNADNHNTIVHITKNIFHTYKRGKTLECEHRKLLFSRLMNDRRQLQARKNLILMCKCSKQPV